MKRRSPVTKTKSQVKLLRETVFIIYILRGERRITRGEKVIQCVAVTVEKCEERYADVKRRKFGGEGRLCSLFILCWELRLKGCREGMEFPREIVK